MIFTHLKNNKNKLYVVVLFSIILLSFMGTASAETFGPSPELNDDIDLDVSVVEDENGEPQTESATILYRVDISAEVSRDTYPFIYPIELEYNENGDEINTEIIYLTPTQSDNYIPSYGENPDIDHKLEESVDVYIAFDDQNSTRDREIEFNVHSRLTGDETSIDTITEVEGETPPGRNLESSIISITEGPDEPTSIRNVDRFRIQSSDSSPNFLEDFSIPEPSFELSGELNDFQEMREAGGNVSILQGDSNGLGFVTLTRDIDFSEPQTLTISYNTYSDSDLFVNPLSASGSEIDVDTNYTLPSDPDDSEHCTSVDSDDNICIFTLNEDEMNEINNLGEAYIGYESDEDYAGHISCQSIISGYFPSDGETCGRLAVVDTGLIHMSGFEGRDANEASSDWSSPRVAPGFSSDGDSSSTSEALVDLRVSVDAALEDEQEVDVVIANKSAVSESGIDSDEIITEETVNVEDETTEVIAQDNVYSSDVLHTYTALICQSGSDCTSNDIIDSEELDVIRRDDDYDDDDDDEKPNLVMEDPLRSDLDVESITEIIVDRDTTFTTDSDFENIDRGNEDWEQVGSESDFEGTLTESVVVRDVSTNNEEEYISEAIEKRSDIGPEGSWEEDYDISISSNSYEEQFATESPGEEWRQVGDSSERNSQVGTQLDFFEVIDGEDLSSVIDSNTGWYIDRTVSPSDAPDIDGSIETRFQHTDPDECYNCLKSETLDEAEERFDDTENRDIIETEGEDIWQRVSDEPAELSTLRENNYDLIQRNTNPGEGYRSILDSSEDENIWRTSSFETEEVYEWIRVDDLQQLPFSAPVNEEAYLWETETFDITYTFTGEIEQPSELYEYEREVTEERVEYETDTIWFDYSDSYARPEGSTKTLDTLRINYQGINNVYQKDWVEEVHSLTPEEQDNFDELSSCSIEELGDAAGGTAIQQVCEYNNEEIITRFGQEIDESGRYAHEVELIDNLGATTIEDHDININEGPASPRFEIDSVSDRVDYNLDDIAFEGIINTSVSDAMSQHRLDDRYILSVSPADDIDTVFGCPSGYEEVSTFDLQSESETSDTFREVQYCQSYHFEDTSIAPEEFQIRSLTVFDGGQGGYTQTYEDIPEKAIQSCSSPLESTEEEGECLGVNDETVTYMQGEEYQEVDSEKLGGQCPAGYEETSNTYDDGSDTITEYTCELNEEAEFDIMSRQTSVQYDSIQSGVITECEDIPVSSESGTHSGYETVTDGDSSYCNLIDSNDPGPTEFEISEEFVVNGETETDYKTIPAGAVRGETLIDNTDINECTELYEEDGNLKCDYETGNTDTTIQYGQLIVGDWNSLDNNIERLTTDLSEKILWDSEFVAGGEEQISTFINPREIPNAEPGQEVQFDFRLKNYETGNSIQNEQVYVELCEAHESSTLPREDTTDNECNDFDTLMTGVSDYDENRQSINDVLDKVDEEGPGTYDIETVKNDACPYNRNYPRNHEDIEPLSVFVDSDTTYSELRTEVEDYLYPYYGGINPCGDSDDMEVTPPTEESENFQFDRESFDEPTSLDNIRRIGLDDLFSIQSEPAQSYWNEEYLGNSLRLGTPVLESGNQNQNLISMYTFDHDPSIISSFDGENVDYHLYRINDVYHPEIEDAYGGVASGDYQENIHHARLWFGSPCERDNLYHHHTRWGTPYDSNSDEWDISMDCYRDDFDETLLSRDYVKNNWTDTEYLTGRTGAESETILDNQAAFLPVPATTDSASETGIEDDKELEFFSSTEPGLSDSYSSQGIFGGRALSLSSTSWMSLTPPVLDEDSIGESVEDVGNEEPFGHSELYSSSFVEPTESLNEQLEEEYTISFWVKKEDVLSLNNEPGSQHPFRTIIGLGIPYGENSPYEFSNTFEEQHTTAELSYMTMPGLKDSESDLDKRRYPYQTSESIEGTRGLFQDGIGWAVNEDYLGESGAYHDVEEDDDYFIRDRDVSPNQWTHVSLVYEGDYSEGSFGDDVGRFEVYIDGERQSEQSEAPEEFSFGDSTQTEMIDSGAIYEDSVISLGARYQDPSYTLDTNGIYEPIIEASAGNILIDELRVYDEALNPIEDIDIPGEETESDRMEAITYQPDDSVISGADNVYTGHIQSQILTEDTNGNIIEEIEPLSTINVDVEESSQSSGAGDYNIEIIPCESDVFEGDECYRSASATISNDGVENSEAVMFDTDELNDRMDSETIDAFMLRVELKSYDLINSPMIDNIDLTINPAPYRACQELQSQYESFEGASLQTSIIDNTAIATTYCDMETDDGGWTQFYWVEEGESYAEFNSTDNEAPLLSDKKRDECHPTESPICLSTPNFDIPPSMDVFNDFHESVGSESHINPHIMIKAIGEDGETLEWAAYDFNPLKFSLSAGTGDGENMDGVEMFTEELENGEDVNLNRIEEEPYCLNAYSASANHDGECITDFRITTLQQYMRLSNSEWLASERVHNYVHADFRFDESEQVVEEVTCLDRTDVERCEMHYRMDSSGDYTEID